MSVAVQIDRVSKGFSAYPALKGVSLSIEPGELVALLGPSGSGKTTLLRLIAGLEEADGGAINFNGTDVRRLNLRERRIGFVFQNYALFKHMTVAENIAFGLTVRSRPERPDRQVIKKRVDDLLELVQLGGLQQRFPAQLSGGQRQRVALARALAIEPQVLLLDEPFGALDAQVRKDLRQWLRSLHQRTGHTTLFVTHDQEEALELADRVAILNQGLIEQIGTPDQVYDHPTSAFVCGFLGEANRIPVDVRNGQALFQSRSLLTVKGTNATGPAELFVRPHHLKIDAPELAPLTGEVALIRRHGAVRRAEILVKGIVRRLDVDLASAVVPNLGEQIGLRVGHGHVFDSGLTPSSIQGAA